MTFFLFLAFLLITNYLDIYRLYINFRDERIELTCFSLNDTKIPEHIIKIIPKRESLSGISFQIKYVEVTAITKAPYSNGAKKDAS